MRTSVQASRRAGSLGLTPVRSLSPVREEYELFQYEWPDLPPIGQITDAVARRTLAQGISYVLPVNKSAQSLQQVYRTDLRVMFREPYLSQGNKYRDDYVMENARRHLVVNSAPVSALRSACPTEPGELNRHSAGVRRAYLSAVPPRGVTGKHTDVTDLRRRSNLHRRLQSKLPPEALRMKQEAERIIQSITEEAEELQTETAVSLPRIPQSAGRPGSGAGRRTPDTATSDGCELREILAGRADVTELLTARLRNPYMSEGKTREILDWLQGERGDSDIDTFLSLIC